MRIKVFNLILTHDIRNSQTVALSINNNQIILPFTNIENPKTILQEIRYFVKNLFDDPELKHIELIDISFIEIQNDLLINYVKEIDLYEYDEDQDLCIFVGVILSEKNKTGLSWLPIGYPSVSKDNGSPVVQSSSIDILVDYVIKNIVL